MQLHGVTLQDILEDWRYWHPEYRYDSDESEGGNVFLLQSSELSNSANLSSKFGPPLCHSTQNALPNSFY